MHWLDFRGMEDVVVKVFQGEAEVASEAIFSPATDAEAKDCLQDTNAAWVGKLTEPNRSPGLVGRRRNLTPGAIYHLHLQEQSGRCTPAPLPGVVIAVLSCLCECWSLYDLMLVSRKRREQEKIEGSTEGG